MTRPVPDLQMVAIPRRWEVETSILSPCTHWTVQVAYEGLRRTACIRIGDIRAELELHLDSE